MHLNHEKKPTKLRKLFRISTGHSCLQVSRCLSENEGTSHMDVLKRFQTVRHVFKLFAINREVSCCGDFYSKAVIYTPKMDLCTQKACLEPKQIFTNIANNIF